VVDINKIGDKVSGMKWGKGKTILASIAGVLFATWMFSGFFVAHNDQTKVIVIQTMNGKMSCGTDAGYYLTWGGTYYTYPKRAMFSFSKLPDQGSPTDESLPINFGDGAVGHISGTVSWEMPSDCPHVIQVHQAFTSEKGVDQQLIRPVVQNAIRTTGPLMTSFEAKTARQNELNLYIEDQVQLGSYLTETSSSKEADPITGVMKTVSISRIKRDADGKILRTDDAPITKFGIHVYNLSLNAVDVPKNIEDQIAKQQDATASIQIAIADAKKAEQAAITAAKQGEANAATARWTQEALKATAVTKAEQEQKVAQILADQAKSVAETKAAQDKSVAETKALQDKSVAETMANQKLQVAQLGVQTADANKQAAILEGEGQAQAKKLVMTADGQLALRLDAYKETTIGVAQAFAQASGRFVPTVSFGGTNGASDSASVFNNAMQAQLLSNLKQFGLTPDLSSVVQAPAPAK